MSQLKQSQQLKIPFKVIKKATESFKTCIGKGGYGQVYKGQLVVSGQLTTVAVKRLNEQLGQGLKEFLTEIELLKGQKHPNLISLIGYCEEGNEKIIVYEYAERGSLDKYLTRNDNTTTIMWMDRLRICVDIARGLDYLHNHFGEHQRIIHRDIKSANILLDHNWVAKVSDLGLSKLSLAGLDRSAVISHACGTAGYCEPEYISSGVVTKESDVYSFGMVLLEILCGRLCSMIDIDGLSLPDYYRNNKLYEIVDPSIKQQMSSDSLTRYLEIAYGCLYQDRGQRHTMDRAMKDLEELLQIEISSDELLGWSSDSDFTTLVTRRNNVGKLFDIFDLNRDGGLNRQELAAFLLVSNFNAKHGEEHIDTCVDDVFWYYDKYIDGEKGFTYHGLLQYYDDGRGDLDSDIVQVLSDSDSDNDVDDDDNEIASRRWQKLVRIFQKLNLKKNGFTTATIASHKSLFEKTSGLCVKVFNLYHKFMHRKSGLTVDSLLKTAGDDGASESETLGILLKPHIDEEVALWFSSPKSLVVTEHFTNSPIFLLFFTILMILLITTMLVKLKYIWFLLVILFNY